MRRHVPEALPVLEPGSVWLVGAGPGDPGLVSWLAVHALRSADAVLHDRGLEEALDALALAGPASLEPVESGAAAAEAALTRAIRLARDGWRVVRLVAGDPLSRGQGVAAALALAEADIGFRIVPGISPAVAGLSYAGVPVTQRHVNSAFAALDVSEAAFDELPAALGRLLATTPAVVTGLDGARLGELAQALLDAGVPGATPLLVVARPTARDQVNVETTLEAAAEDAPVVVGKVVLAIGANVRLRASLAWRDRAARVRSAPSVLSFAGLAG
jgi:uroporphyrin-III C-methyltransferase